MRDRRSGSGSPAGTLVSVTPLSVLALLASPTVAIAGSGPAAGATAPPPLDPPAAAVEFATRAAPADTLGLEEALRTALARNPDLSAAAARADAEAAARWAQWGAFLPSASADVSFTRSDFTTVTFLSPEGVPRSLPEPVTDVSKSASQGLSFQLDLLRGGQRFTELSAGAARREAADLRLGSAERSVVARVKTSYFEALKQQRLAEVAERQLAARRQDLENTRERYRIAAADRTDLLGAEVQVGEAELALEEARDAAARGRRQLALHMGLDEDRPIPADVLEEIERVPDAGALEVRALTDRMLSANPELAALEADASAASASLWGARSLYLPTVSLSYSLGRSERLGPEGSLFTLDPSNRSGNLAITASWNLFAGFDRREQTARASASLREAEAERTRRRLELVTEIRDGVGEIRRRARRLEKLDRIHELAEERLRLARERYRLGSIDFFELQSSIRELTTAERNLFQERYDYLSAWARLEESAGVPLGQSAGAAEGG